MNLGQLARKQSQMDAAWLASLGRDHDQRVNSINAMYEERRATLIGMALFSLDRKGQAVMSSTSLIGQAHITFVVSRNLAGLDNRECEYWRIIELLNSAANGTRSWYQSMRISLLLGDGKGILSDVQVARSSVFNGKFEKIVSDVFGTVDKAVNLIQQHIAGLDGKPSLSPAYRAIVDEAKDRINPSAGGGWLKPAEVSRTVFAASSPFALHIGSFKSGGALQYSGEGSMVTIAPPGSGKTQCNVFPNLLTWKGPAIVLDISGDIYEHTAGWRSANVGPVYKFSPLEPESSHKYNPLTFVRNDPDYLWEDARLLAEMMIVPQFSNDPFWENEARTVLTSAMAYVCYVNPPDQRPMHAVLDILFGGKPWEEMIMGMRMAVNVRVMTQHASALSSMNEKTLSSVLQTARSSLSAWSGERIARATQRSDWNPIDLRSTANPTIYIYIRPNEVEAYLSLLRVFIGQHIRVLTAGAVPDRGSPPILVMLDELPRLRYMAPVDEALSIGRKYGLRLWMFAQSVGQLQNAYENADGMLGSCAVRVFMNPSGADGLAEKLSEELGYVDSVHDNSRKRLVEAADLAGPKFKDSQIVMGLGTKPAVVGKDFAWRHPELNRRMSIPAPHPVPPPPPPPLSSLPPPPGGTSRPDLVN
jgi:type IV secretion system protein VirD4